MQTVKGLIALLLVALVVFAVAATNDIRSQAKYAAQLRRPAVATMAGRTAVNSNAVGKAGNVTTNVVNQARRKAPRT
jgi:hypothetical protein